MARMGRLKNNWICSILVATPVPINYLWTTAAVLPVLDVLARIANRVSITHNALFTMRNIDGFLASGLAPGLRMVRYAR